MLVGLLVLISALLPLPVFAQQATCTHYASPGGTGAVCTQGTPCKIASFWKLAGAGKTLCLQDGTYVGWDSMIAPPAGVSGASAEKPITVRAVNDGKVLVDAKGGGFAVFLGWWSGQSNNWFVIEGIDATGGKEATYQVSGSNNLLRRVVGYHGTDGQNDSNIFRIAGYGSRAEDCAGWGNNSRKVMDGAQGGNLQGAGYRRCWAEWNDHPMGPNSHPSNTFELGYNSSNQIYENVIGTWDTRGQTSEIEGIFHMFGTNKDTNPHDMEGSKLLGSIAYAAPGQTVPKTALVAGYGMTGMLLRDVVAVMSPEHGAVMPFYFGNYMCTGDKPCVNNVCQNCLSIHAGTPLWNDANTGWTFPGFRQGQGLQAATGGVSPFTLLPGICKRYVNGQLTTVPLWPWPMNQRIKDARVRSGYPAVDVTATIEDLLGPIPASCKSNGGSVPPPGIDPPPVVIPPVVAPPLVIPPVVIPPVGVELPPVTLPSFNGPMTCTWTTTMTMQCVPSEP